jgi:cyclopropane fatty-acyl-phospholipid synthase-like methyltransferase
MSWWQSFFDAEYLRLWASMLTPERTAAEAAALVDLLGIRAGSRVLDAPCGSGRISRALAEQVVPPRVASRLAIIATRK